MERKAFQTWLAAVEQLTDAQKAEAGEVLSGRPAGKAAVAAIELGVGEDRRCPHCQTPDAVARGHARGLRRYCCKGCGKTFNALTGTALSRLRHKERWLEFGQAVAEGDTVAASAERCGVAISTAFRWRHRFLKAARADGPKLRGIVEADETFVLASRKGARNLGRKPRKRGGKASKRGISGELVPILIAADRTGVTASAVLPGVNAAAFVHALGPVVDKDALLVTDACTSYPPCAAALGISHEVLNQSAKERVRGELHIQTVNNRHSRLKDFLRQHRGVATKYLDSYLRWFHLIRLQQQPTPRACLAAAMGG